jgi:hypothetical protein
MTCIVITKTIAVKTSLKNLHVHDLLILSDMR